MTVDRSAKRALAVVTAMALILLLGGTLAVRVFARSAISAAPPRGSVPAPPPLALSELPEPFCWGCSWNRDVPLNFQIDLDLLAPLGDGQANAAQWFKEFAKGGARFSPDRFQERKVELTIDGQTWNVFPADDPLLLEAEPWIDQATCRFYPDVWQVAGAETQVPQLLLMIDLARSWVARGMLSEDPRAAYDDYRRAIRLGRLLRQDDVTLIQDLVAIAVIRIGAEGIYRHARQDGDAQTMLVTALVLADKDAMRMLTAQRITVFERMYASDESIVRITDADPAPIVEFVRTLTDRRFRMEGLIVLHAVAGFGTPEQRRIASEALEEFARTDDPIIAEMIRYYRENPMTENDLNSFFAGP